jgi:hypothetical protein
MKTKVIGNKKIEITGYKPLFGFNALVEICKENNLTVAEIKKSKSTNSYYAVFEIDNNEGSYDTISIRCSDHTSALNFNDNHISVFNNGNLELDVISNEDFKNAKFALVQFIQNNK